MLAKAWGVPEESITKYIRQWATKREDSEDDEDEDEEESQYEVTLKGKAYPKDRFEYGDYDQLFDLLAKLHYTKEMKWFFELKIPKRNFSLKREFVEDLSKPANK